MLSGKARVRTVIPLTTPSDFVTRNPGRSNVVVVCMGYARGKENPLPAAGCKLLK